jgi:hypothetical protein
MRDLRNAERILDVAPVSEALKKTEQLLPPSDGT